MPRRPTRLAPLAAAGALALLATTRAAAQATPEVSPLDPASRQVEVLAALGLADTVLVAQRPYSRREIARVAAAARRTVARWEAQLGAAATPSRRLAARLAAGRAALAPLESEYAAEIAALEARTAPPARGRALALASVDVTGTNAVQRATPGTPLGTSDAATRPLTEYREGRPVVRGATAFAETVHWGATRFVAASARLRARVAPADEAASAARYPTEQALSVAEAQLRLVAGPWALTVGRDALAWGQGAFGGPLLSSNAPPLDLVMLATDVPIRVPLVWRVLGPMKGAAFFSDLGDRQRFPGGNLTGFRLSSRPLRGFELGIGTVNQWGGVGSPHASFGDRLLDQLVIIDSFGGVTDIQVSNKIAGVDMRVRVPSLGGLSAYYEVQFDDFDLARVGSSFSEDAAHVVGVRAAALGPDARWELGVEARRTGLRLYQHSDFTSGLTHERFLLGDPLGPQARGAYLRAGRRTGGGGVWLDLAAERRRNDQYTSTDVPPPFHFSLTEERPAETRLRAVAAWESAAWGRRGAVALLAQAGVERVRGDAFQAGATRTNGLARLGVEWRGR